MGLLDKLWDDTLAGPRPESGLGRLRKYSSFAFRPSSSSALAAKDEAAATTAAAASGSGPPVGVGCSGLRRSLSLSDEKSTPEAAPPQVTRSIMIKRPPGWASPGSNGTPPSSPAGSTPPISPFSGGGGGRFRRRSTSDAQEKSAAAASSKSYSYPPFEV